MFSKKSTNIRTARGNLYLEGAMWTVAVFVGIVLVCAGYDFFCNCMESCNTEQAKMPWFIYKHSEVVIALIGILFGALAVFVTIKVNETMSFHSFNVRYGQDAMLDAVRNVAAAGRMWAKSSLEQNPKFITPCFISRSESFNPNGRININNRNELILRRERFFPWSKDQDYARRRLKNYFSSALELYRSHSISKKILRNICDNDSFRLLFMVVEPMEAIMNDKYNYDVFYELMDVMKDVYAKYAAITESHDDVRHYWDGGRNTWTIENT